MEVNTPQVSEIKGANKTSWLLIILLVLFFSFLSIVGTYYFLTVYQEEEVISDEEVIEKEKDILTEVEEEIEIIKTYLNENYPNMEIEYPSSWFKEVKEEQFEGREEEREEGGLMRVSEPYKDTLVTFSKEGYTLSIFFDTFPYITSVPGNCYLEGELDYIRIEEGLTRNSEDMNKYVYSGLLYDKDYSPNLSWEDSKTSPMGCGDGDYIASGFSDILGITKTEFLFTRDYVGENKRNISAYVSAILEISAEEDDLILKEADDIVFSLYNSIKD